MMLNFKLGDKLKSKSSGYVASITSIDNDRRLAYLKFGDGSGSNWSWREVNAGFFLVETAAVAEDNEPVIWTVRVDGSVNHYFLNGAGEVAVFVRGVRAVNPDAIIERQVWEQF